MTALLLAGIIILGFLPMASVAIDGNQARSTLFSVDLHNVTSLQGLIGFSVQNRIAIGIVLTPKPGLCGTLKRLALTNVTVRRIMDGLLNHSGYTWSYDNGVFVIRPRSIPASSEHILRLRYPVFKSSETTFQGLGITLSGSILSTLEPDAGYAASVLSSSESRKVKPFTLENVTVEQIADYIVGLDGKGAWILAPDPYDAIKGGKNGLRIYGYEDDARALKGLSCPIEPQLQ